MEDNGRYIYLIGSPVMREVKIGLSDQPARRALALQTGSPVELLVILAVPGSATLERKLHEYFKAYRTHGEWFDFGDENPVTLVVSAATLMGYPVHPKRVASGNRPRVLDIDDESPESVTVRLVDHLVRAAEQCGCDFVTKREVFAYLASINPEYAPADGEPELQYLTRAGMRLAAALKAEGTELRPVQRRKVSGIRAWGYATHDLVSAARAHSQRKPKRTR